MGGACSTYGKEERCIIGLVGKTEGKRLLGRHWCSMEDNIKKDILEVEWGSWTD
jgi:hypothetical protein